MKHNTARLVVVIAIIAAVLFPVPCVIFMALRSNPAPIERQPAPDNRDRDTFSDRAIPQRFS